MSAANAKAGRRLRRRSVVACAIGALLLAACDGGGGNDAKVAVTPVEGSGRVTVVADGGKFNVERIEVAAGATTSIALENRDAVAHTFTVYVGGAEEGTVAADTGEVPAGETGEAVVFFAGAGERIFRCEIHPGAMRGTLIVR